MVLELMPMQKNGFVVSREDLESFFDKRLLQAGLLGNEISDFKAFWIEKMMENNSPYFFISFLFNDYMDKAAPLRVSPLPDTVIRLFMEWRPLQKPIKVNEQNLVTPKRKGFTVVEWGGSLHE